MLVDAPIHAQHGGKAQSGLVGIEREFTANDLLVNNLLTHWIHVVGMDVLHPTVIVVAGIDGTSAKEEAEVVRGLVGGTEGEAEVILAALEVRVERVAIVGLLGHLLGLSHGSGLVHALGNEGRGNVLGELSHH